MRSREEKKRKEKLTFSSSSINCNSTACGGIKKDSENGDRVSVGSIGSFGVLEPTEQPCF